MSTEHNIWKTPDGDLPEEKLTAYFEGRLSKEEQWEVEQWLGEAGAEADAIEGLSLVSPEEAQTARRHINARLQQSLSRKRSGRKYLSNQNEVIVTVLVVLLIIIICFGIMWYLKHYPHLNRK